MQNIGGIVKTLQNIMRKDQAFLETRRELSSWAGFALRGIAPNIISYKEQQLQLLMITLKIIDDKEAEMELISDDYPSVSRQMSPDGGASI